MNRKKYDRFIPHAVDKAKLEISPQMFDALWEIFLQIGRFWDNMVPEEAEKHKISFLNFLYNRISVDPIYFAEYELAIEVIEELKANFPNTDSAFDELFTNPEALYSPPMTSLARTRQRVSNEFISFQLSVGGFKKWGAINWPGYIAGANIPGEPTPYRTPKQDYGCPKH